MLGIGVVNLDGQAGHARLCCSGALGPGLLDSWGLLAVHDPSSSRIAQDEGVDGRWTIIYDGTGSNSRPVAVSSRSSTGSRDLGAAGLLWTWMTSVIGPLVLRVPTATVKCQGDQIPSRPAPRKRQSSPFHSRPHSSAGVTQCGQPHQDSRQMGIVERQ